MHLLTTPYTGIEFIRCDHTLVPSCECGMNRRCEHGCGYEIGSSPCQCRSDYLVVRKRQRDKIDDGVIIDL